MRDHIEPQGLLHMLNSLFSHISLLDLEKRKQSYRPHAATSHDLGALLGRNIERIAAHHGAGQGRPSRSRQRPETAPSSATAAVGSPEPGQAADYSGNQGTSLTSVPYLGDKLASSAWSHIHSALLYAHQGDIGLARLHADIASQAAREAAHYMSEEDYEQFMQNIEQALSRLEPHSH